MVDEVIVTTSSAQYENIRSTGIQQKIIVDIIPGKASIGGIYTGLMYSANYHNLVVGCDMPFLNVDLLHYMLQEVAGYDALVPKFNGFMEPLHAVYSKNCIPVIENLINENDLMLNKIFPALRTRYLTSDEIGRYDPHNLSIFNINTQEDLINATKIFSESK